jgi:hypothetical protein
LAKILHQVKYERVVVIDDEDAGHGAILAGLAGGLFPDLLFSGSGFPCSLRPMPKSKLRKKVQEKHAHEEQIFDAEPHAPLESPSWLAPVMVANFLIGLFWIVIFYVSQTTYPIPGIGAWNMIIGFSFVGVGFSLATKWR